MVRVSTVRSVFQFPGRNKQNKLALILIDKVRSYHFVFSNLISNEESPFKMTIRPCVRVRPRQPALLFNYWWGKTLEVKQKLTLKTEIGGDWRGDWLTVVLQDGRMPNGEREVVGGQVIIERVGREDGGEYQCWDLRDNSTNISKHVNVLCKY